jgi:diguanylate cyclase (GGDEF)-like protein
MTFTYRSHSLNLDSLHTEIDLLEPDRAVAVAVLDLDGFGPVNEKEGGAAGDALLGRFEEALLAALPESALVAHLRGDEFAVALPDVPPESLLVALDAIRRAVGDAEPVTVSGGVAGRPQQGVSTDELLSAADSALVRSKRDGGNRISIAIEERMLLKTSYYPPAVLHRLAKLARRTGRPEASLLREALDDLVAKHRDEL